MFCLTKPPLRSPLSLRTFVKHLPDTNHKPLKFHIIHRKSIASRNSLNSETLTSHQKDQISLYVDTLLQWNQKMNLTAVRDKSEVMERHIDDSLAILPPILDSYASHCGSSSSDLNVVDVGSGAGLPGLVLAIACPEWKVTLLESMKKRCLFLEHVINVTGLSNVKVVRGRAEVKYSCFSFWFTSTKNVCSYNPLTIGQNLGQSTEMREAFDVAVARAVAELRILAEYCIPLVRVGGLFVAAKGHDPRDEIISAERAIQMLGASILQQSAVESHSRYGQRTAILCLKECPTPSKYPRDPGTPAKMPL